jgi:hypothetical protein
MELTAQDIAQLKLLGYTQREIEVIMSGEEEPDYDAMEAELDPSPEPR